MGAALDQNQIPMPGAAAHLVRSLLVLALVKAPLAAYVPRFESEAVPVRSAAVFAAFQCEELSDGSRWLRADLSVDCDSGTHSAFQAYAGLMVLLYPIGTPLYYLYLLRRNRAALERLEANQTNRIKLIERARATRDYASGRVARDQRQVPWLIAEEERSNLAARELDELRRKLAALRASAGQPPPQAVVTAADDAASDAVGEAPEPTPPEGLPE